MFKYCYCTVSRSFRACVTNLFLCACTVMSMSCSLMLPLFHRIPINYLLVNLAVADILYVTFITPSVFIVQFSFTNLPDGVTGTVLCKFFTTGTVAWVGAASSILTLSVVAVERYYAVVYPLGDKEKITMDNLKVSPRP